MKKFQILFFAGLLMAAPASAAHTHLTPASYVVEEALSDATAQQVLDAAAPQVGETAASLYGQYKSGAVQIADLGPIRGGHRYEVSRGQDFIIIIDIID
jgi:hypothetical protein